ncbi:ABC transporter ATP-binding protein [Vibrio sp. ZSDZ34]|jgi:putative ABC transport system ATP-binding protein|uniref:ABC transporter ATP-binding protein n=1 Tax=Vibrio gelatinilyticus TaxID=2893468 RepID=A0A9X1WI93_9VIBR|nr:ABC transporter ATP-binding protein [Vibrio gelatinilyticus]MCJ2377144.1 ABC transporter ATP-binding protein [Vibrio gelatinilyticus]
MRSTIIKAESINKVVSTKSESLTILKNVSLDIYQGETVAIVGTSGAGKTTLMTLLAGLDRPSEGRISLLGNTISELDDEERAAIRSQNVGFVFQSFLLIPSLTALDNVTLPCLLRGEKEDQKQALRLLDSVGLKDRADHLPSQLSGGEQQRVSIARAFMTNPDVLFADEPTGNLDQKTAQKVVELLFDLNAKHGTTLVLVTHDLALADKCDRVLLMNNGTLKESTDEQ